jgi:hypothetical protein
LTAQKGHKDDTKGSRVGNVGELLFLRNTSGKAACRAVWRHAAFRWDESDGVGRGGCATAFRVGNTLLGTFSLGGPAALRNPGLFSPTAFGVDVAAENEDEKEDEDDFDTSQLHPSPHSPKTHLIRSSLRGTTFSPERRRASRRRGRIVNDGKPPMACLDREQTSNYPA